MSQTVYFRSDTNTSNAWNYTIYTEDWRWVCGRCNNDVDLKDAYCRHCGIKFNLIEIDR